jgi:hypothetical protein
MKKPFLVKISIEVIHDKFLIDVAALSGDVHILSGIGQGLNSEMLADENDLEVLLRSTCVGLHQEIARFSLLLTLGDGNHLAVHLAHDFYWIVDHYILLIY